MLGILLQKRFALDSDTVVLNLFQELQRPFGIFSSCPIPCLQFISVNWLYFFHQVDDQPACVKRSTCLSRIISPPLPPVLFFFSVAFIASKVTGKCLHVSERGRRG